MRIAHFIHYFVVNAFVCRMKYD